MNESFPNMKFYSLEKSKLEGINKDNDLIDIKSLKSSKEFNEALASVINKDIAKLLLKLKNIIKDITKLLAKNGVTFNVPIECDINNIDEIINAVESKTSEMIIKKGNIKVGFFSSNKKEKKKSIENLEEDLKVMAKLQNDIMSLKNEYEKLNDRLNSIGYSAFTKEEIEDSEDPLERTINFYMNKDKK